MSSDERRVTAVAGALGSGRVLVLDDEHMVRKVISRMLSNHGFQVTAASHGAEARGAFQAAGERAAFDVLVTDLSLGNENGEEIAAELQALRPQLKVLFVSGLAQAPVPVTGKTGTAHLAKPFSSRQLVQAVRTLISAGKSRPSGE